MYLIERNNLRTQVFIKLKFETPQARDALVSVVSKLVVRRAPTDVVIRQLDTMTSMMGFSSNNDTIDVLENTNVTLECSSVGGQPPPKLYWELPESLPSFSLSETVRNGSAVSVISVLVIRWIQCCHYISQSENVFGHLTIKIQCNSTAK